MIERKRRNDFVRKREFDMLRKVRREGLSSEQLAALGGSSRLDDSQPRASESAGAARTPASRPRSTRSSSRWWATATPARSAAAPSSTTRRPSRCRSTWPAGRRPTPPTPQPPGRPGRGFRARRPSLPARSSRPCRPRRRSRLDRPDQARPARRPSDFGQAFAANSAEVTHDPDLDEAVIAFANADFEQCEQSLVGADRPRRRPRPACRDLAGAVRPLPRDRPAAQVREPGARLRAAVRLVGAAVVLDAEDGRRGGQRGAAERQPRVEGQVGWVCPQLPRCRRRRQAGVAGAADAAALGVRLGRAADASTPRPAAACPSCSAAGSRRTSTCAGSRGERLFTVLQEAAPTGVRDADPAFWQLRLDALRMTNRPDQFDEAAIDYCVTYEVSPPSWEPAQVRRPHQRLEPEHDRAAAVGGERRLDQLPRVAADRRHRHGRRWRRSSSPASWSATSARR